MSCRKNLEAEIESYRAEGQVQSRNIVALEREKEKYAQEAAEASGKYMQVGGALYYSSLGGLWAW